MEYTQGHILLLHIENASLGLSCVKSCLPLRSMYKNVFSCSVSCVGFLIFQFVLLCLPLMMFHSFVITFASEFVVIFLYLLVVLFLFLICFSPVSCSCCLLLVLSFLVSDVICYVISL